MSGDLSDKNVGFFISVSTVAGVQQESVHI